MYSSIEISILIHATENESKVLKSFIEFVGQSGDSLKMESIKTEGHWKNSILRLIISINMDADKIFDKLYTHLVEIYGESDTNNYIKTNTDKKGYFYARLDKQKFCIGKIILSDRDSVRMVFKKLGKFELQIRG
ncbi:MAG: RNA-binding domain-containing protein [Candidatus Nitrosocosmicus sp.]